jgi:hypothetical protein
MSTTNDGSGGGSRPSKTNRQGCAQGTKRPETLDPADIESDAALRPVSVEPGTKLRTEAVDALDRDERQARPVYEVVNEWREWYADYRSMHIEYEGPDGETARTQLENSYQPEYGKRYYAKLKDLERGIERRYESLTTAMLTFTASHQNANGEKRCPADHMRDIAEGFKTARKQLYVALRGKNWQYAKVWEPHESGYGHMHIAVFVEDADVTGEMFKPVLNSYVKNTKAAGSEAHSVGNAVSVNDDIENLGSYISEYIGIFGDETLERPISEQMFYATTWATGTRRVEFSNGAQDIINGEQFRRETGLRPSDRGEGTSAQADESGAESDEDLAGVRIDPESETVERVDEGGAESDESDGWTVDRICTVRGGSPEFAEPTTGGADMVAIDGRPGMDPPPEVD